MIPPVPDDRRILRLSDKDTVGVALTALVPGETVRLGDKILCVASHVPAGHKIALQSIAAGEKVIKYGASIGTASQRISPGEHVHTHNLASDFLPTRGVAGDSLSGAR